MNAPITVVVFGTSTLGGMVEADKNARLVTIVLDRNVEIICTVNDTVDGAMFKVAQSSELVGQTVGYVTPDDAVVVFVVIVFVVDAADALRGEIHHKVAIVGRELATGIHAACVVGRVVVDDAVFEGRLGIVIEVDATAFGRSYIIVDAAVGVVGTYAVAHAAAHRGDIVGHDAVV